MRTHYDDNDEHTVDIMEDVLDPEEINNGTPEIDPDIDPDKPF